MMTIVINHTLEAHILYFTSIVVIVNGLNQSNRAKICPAGAILVAFISVEALTVPVSKGVHATTPNVQVSQGQL